MANTIIKATAFAETVKDYVEGKGILTQIAQTEAYPAVGAGATVKIPVIPFLGEAKEVVNGVANYDDVKDESVTATFKQFDRGTKLTDMELLDSVIDRNVDVRAILTADSLVYSTDLELLKAADTNSIKLEVAEINGDSVLEAEGLMGQKFSDRKAYLVGNGKTISKLQKGITSSNLVNLSTGIYDAEFKRFDAVEADVYYIIQESTLKVLVAKDITTNVYRESDFHGEKTNSNIIIATAVAEQGRIVKVSLDDGV